MPRAHLFVPILAAALGMAAPAALAAGPDDYALDPVHTRIVFVVEHAGFSKAMGTISGSTGTLRFDRDDWRSAQLDVTVPLTRLDLGDAKWNNAVLAANLLDGKRHPEARFVSSRVEPVDASHAKVCGDLTLRGTTRPVCLDVSFNALKRHPMPPFRRTAGFSATATLSRKEFGIEAWPNVIGDSVGLLIEAEAVRRRAAQAAPGEPEPPEDEDAGDLEPLAPEAAPEDQEPPLQEEPLPEPP